MESISVLVDGGGHRRWISAPTFRLDSTLRSPVDLVADQSAILGSASRRGLEGGQGAFSAFLVAERPAQTVCAEMRPTWCTFGPSFAPAVGDLWNFWARGGPVSGAGRRMASHRETDWSSFLSGSTGGASAMDLCINFPLGFHSSVLRRPSRRPVCHFGFGESTGARERAGRVFGVLSG